MTSRIKQLLFVVAAFGMTACGALAGGTLPSLFHHAAVPLGIVAAFHQELLPPEQLAMFCAPTHQLATTIRTPQLSADAANALIAQVAQTSCDVDVLIERADLTLCADMGRVRGARWIELGNELDLAPEQLTASAFGVFERACLGAIRAGGYTGGILSGGVYTCSPETFSYLRKANLPAEMLYALHCYNGVENRDLLALGRPFVITEFGLSSNDAASDADAVAYAREQLSSFSGAEAAIWYQANSCDQSNALCHFGIERTNNTFKPLVELFR